MFRSETSMPTASPLTTTGLPAALVVLAALALAGCQPTVKVEAPDKPIVINLNVKIEQEVRVKVEKDVEDLLEDRKDLF
jgi:outer membrane murein-binding lipoprotein Lpp